MQTPNELMARPIATATIRARFMVFPSCNLAPTRRWQEKRIKMRASAGSQARKPRPEAISRILNKRYRVAESSMQARQTSLKSVAFR